MTEAKRDEPTTLDPAYQDISRLVEELGGWVQREYLPEISKQLSDGTRITFLKIDNMGGSYISAYVQGIEFSIARDGLVELEIHRNIKIGEEEFGSENTLVVDRDSFSEYKEKEEKFRKSGTVLVDWVKAMISQDRDVPSPISLEPPR